MDVEGVVFDKQTAQRLLKALAFIERMPRNNPLRYPRLKRGSNSATSGTGSDACSELELPEDRRLCGDWIGTVLDQDDDPETTTDIIGPDDLCDERTGEVCLCRIEVDSEGSRSDGVRSVLNVYTNTDIPVGAVVRVNQYADGHFEVVTWTCVTPGDGETCVSGTGT